MFIEIRWHGRGGQGVVTVSRLLAEAAALEGKHAQAFPEFGPERSGAPVTGYTRISDEPIEIHSAVYDPEIVVVIDPTLIKTVNIVEGIEKNGYVILNFPSLNKNLRKELNLDLKNRIFVVDGNKIAREILGQPIANTAMMGALIKAYPLIKFESLEKILRERFKGEIGERNVLVAKKAYEEVKEIE
jgi:2-oxoacid:acceptor oxidoreductase gamma subunit (pyruvate/2-ketoisovalerate family)